MRTMFSLVPPWAALLGLHLCSLRRADWSERGLILPLIAAFALLARSRATAIVHGSIWKLPHSCFRPL